MRCLYITIVASVVGIINTNVSLADSLENAKAICNNHKKEQLPNPPTFGRAFSLRYHEGYANCALLDASTDAPSAPSPKLPENEKIQRDTVNKAAHEQLIKKQHSN